MTIDPKAVTICHCTYCEINSGTAYGVVVGVTNEEFILEDGKLTLKRLLIVGRGEVLHFVPPAEREFTQNQLT